MATLYGTNATNATQTQPAVNAPVGDYGGRVRMCYDKYPITAALGASDVLVFGRLPKGAKIVEAKVVCPDMGGTGNFKFGYQTTDSSLEASDDDAFGTAIDWSGQALAYQLGATIGFSATGQFKELAADVDVIITLNGVTATTSGTIHVAVLYVLD